VNQNLPPNQPGQSGDYSSGQAANPYYSEPPADNPNLDAGAPQLKNVESQKINAKALLFLGGIVVLLALLTVLVIMSGGDDEQKKDDAPKEQSVITPERPTTLSDPLDPLAAEPIPADQLPPVPATQPPIPVEPTPQQTENANAYSSPPPEAPRGPTLAERRMGVTETGNRDNGMFGQTDPVDAMVRGMQAMQNAQNPQPAQPAQVTKAESERAKFLNNPDTLLLRGTYIRCVLETRIITDLPGFTSCVVTEPVYSVNGRSLLLPKGSKLSGSYSGGDQAGPRVAVVWDRLTTPTGIDAKLNSPGVDNLGSSGHPGDYNAHWASKISSTIFISLLSDAFKYFGEKEGPQTTSVTTSGELIVRPFESNTARAVNQLANQAVARAQARPATVTINQGTVLNVYVAQDVDFSSVVAPRR
jgi:type IV secretion system protein VirB10